MIGKVMPEINKFIPLKFNVLVNKCKKLYSFKKDNTTYRLLEKVERASISDLKFSLDVPKDTVCFSYIKAGKKSDKDFSREVITFFNGPGDVVAKYFRENGLNTKRRLYDNTCVNRRLIQEDKFVTSSASSKSSYEHNRAGGIFVTNFRELQKIEDFPAIKKSGKIPKRLYSKKIFYSKIDNKLEEKITFTVYPTNLGFQRLSEKKVLNGKIILDEKGIALSDVKSTDNVIIDLQDEFLKYRFVDPRCKEGVEALTNEVLRKKGLAPLHINTFLYNIDMNGKSGEFNPNSGNISYYQLFINRSQSQAVNTIVHEVEHAWQLSLIGRLGKGNSHYETVALKELGPVSLNEIDEAVKYAIANDEYPITNLNLDNPKYRDNYLEIKARLAGNKAENKFKENPNYKFFRLFE